MNQKQRDYGRAIAITTLLLIMLIGVLSSCSPQLFKNNKKINITHVLAVTEMGDTLKIPIEAIRPNVIYNVMGYSYGMRPSYYYRPYNYINNTYDYYPYNYGNNNNNNVNYSVPSKPTTSIPTPSSSGNFGGPSGTSGFSGNPTAVNPVTSGGGAKKKNN